MDGISHRRRIDVRRAQSSFALSLSKGIFLLAIEEDECCFDTLGTNANKLGR